MTSFSPALPLAHPQSDPATSAFSTLLQAARKTSASQVILEVTVSLVMGLLRFIHLVNGQAA